MKILFTGKYHSHTIKSFDPSDVVSIIHSMGFEIVKSLNEHPDVVLCADFYKPVLAIVRQAKFQNIPTVLIAYEPSVVIPQHSQNLVLREFDRVLQVGRPETLPSFKWPQTWRSIVMNDHRLNRVVLVNADKWSFIKGQHYWLRAASASQIETIDVFGFGWERSRLVRLIHRIYELGRTLASGAWPNFHGFRYLLARPKSNKGHVSDKIMEMSKYKIALVIENSSEVLTEKLFDAWFAGCIPIYLGPSLETYGIPSHLVVQVEEPTVIGVKDALEIALAKDYPKFLYELNEFLSSGVESQWRAERAVRDILSSAVAEC